MNETHEMTEAQFEHPHEPSPSGGNVVMTLNLTRWAVILAVLVPVLAFSGAAYAKIAQVSNTADRLEALAASVSANNYLNCLDQQQRTRVFNRNARTAVTALDAGASYTHGTLSRTLHTLAQSIQTAEIPTCRREDGQTIIGN